MYALAETQKPLIKHKSNPEGFMYMTAVALTTPCIDSEFMYFLRNILLLILKWVKVVYIAFCLLLVDKYIRDCEHNADKMHMVLEAELITFAAVLGIFWNRK